MDGNCVQSHADLEFSDYEINQACTFVAKSSGILKFERFRTDTNHDMLFMVQEDGSLGPQYSGSSAPADLVDRPIEAGTIFVWATDFDFGDAGFRMCLVP